jgi:segregation and condensation protein B
MDRKNTKAIIEAILFASGREVKLSEITNILDMEEKDIADLIQEMKQELELRNSSIEIIKVEDGYQMCVKKEYYEDIYPIFDNRAKPNLSAAALETLSIIAYNPKITRAEIEMIRGVASDSSIYKLLEYHLIEEAEKSDAPGRPRTYKTTNEFLKTFGLSSLEELPELPRYKIDENEQIVIDDLLTTEEKTEETAEEKIEAPIPEREEQKQEQLESNEKLED